jgi:hypothetical protein
MGKKSKVTFILVLLSIVLLPFFMGGCVIPEFIRALIESQTTPIVQPSHVPLLPSHEALVPTEGLQPLPDGLFFVPIV